MVVLKRLFSKGLVFLMVFWLALRSGPLMPFSLNNHGQIIESPQMEFPQNPPWFRFWNSSNLPWQFVNSGGWQPVKVSKIPLDWKLFENSPGQPQVLLLDEATSVWHPNSSVLPRSGRRYHGLSKIVVPHRMHVIKPLVMYMLSIFFGGMNPLWLFLGCHKFR